MPNLRTWIEIDRSAFKHNVEAIRALTPQRTAFMAVVKANAYGHGLLETATSLAPLVDWFGVENIDEALALRSAGVTAPILLLGRNDLHHAEDAVANEIHQFVYDVESLQALHRAAVRLEKMAHAHVKVDTGMGRQGVLVEELSALLGFWHYDHGVLLSGIATHLAAADDPLFDDYTRAQLQDFKKACAMAGSAVLRHAAASAGTLRFPEAHFDLVRVGLGLYGVHPAPQSGLALALHPVAHMRTRIVQTKTLPAGHSVGYGRTERLQRPSCIAVLPVGYADGYDRRLSRVGEVLIAGKRARVLGTVMMNITVIDVTDIPEAREGSVVTLLGQDGHEHIDAQELAERIGTIPYEVIARLSSTLPRVIV